MSNLPNGWVETILENVCDILDRKRIPVNSRQRNQRIAGKPQDSLYPYYGATGPVGYIDDFLFEGEHVLIGEDGAPFLDPIKNTAYIAGNKFWVNNHAHILRSTISNKYLCHYLNQVNYSEHVTGTTRLKLNQSALKQIPVHFAPLNEQKRIVAKIEQLFSELDKGVEALKTARAQLKVYRQALLKHAFEGKLTAAWREANKDKLESAEALLTRIKTERESRYQQQLNDWKQAIKKWKEGGNGGKKPVKPKPPQVQSSMVKNDQKDLPYGWKWFCVSELCDVVRGGSPRPAGDKRYYDGDIPFLKVADITRNSSAYLDKFSYTIKKLGLQKTRFVNANTLMISNSGATLGVPKICLIEATFNDGIAAFLGLNESLLLYHYYFWQSKTLSLRNINQGAAQPNLNTNIIGETCIPICSQQEMLCLVEELETNLSTVGQMEIDIEAQLKKSETLRQSILKKAFSGKLVPQDPNEEPASVLLERIKAEKVALAKSAKKIKRKKIL